MGVKKKVSLSLNAWIDEIGVQTISKALNVQESAVRHWRRGWVLPRDEVKIKIVKLSHGAVSFEEMITSHFSPENKKNRYASSQK